jgi:hypothetical protein
MEEAKLINATFLLLIYSLSGMRSLEVGTHRRINRKINNFLYNEYFCCYIYI